jgi:hypothetical protein
MPRVHSPTAVDSPASYDTIAFSITRREILVVPILRAVSACDICLQVENAIRQVYEVQWLLVSLASFFDRDLHSRRTDTTLLDFFTDVNHQALDLELSLFSGSSGDRIVRLM